MVNTQKEQIWFWVQQITGVLLLFFLSWCHQKLQTRLRGQKKASWQHRKITSVLIGQVDNLKGILSKMIPLTKSEEDLSQEEVTGFKQINNMVEYHEKKSEKLEKLKTKLFESMG